MHWTAACIFAVSAAAAEICRNWNAQEFFESAGLSELQARLDAGADVNVRDVDVRGENGLMPLHVAASNSASPEVAQVLLDAGANPKAVDDEGRATWDHAQENMRLRDTPVYWELNEARFQEPVPKSCSPNRTCRSGTVSRRFAWHGMRLHERSMHEDAQSDPSNEERAWIEPLLPPPSERGRPRTTKLREMLVLDGRHRMSVYRVAPGFPLSRSAHGGTKGFSSASVTCFEVFRADFRDFPGSRA